MKRRQNDFLMKNFYRKKLLSTGICKNVPYSGILANNKRKFRETLFSRISRWPYFAKFRENKFSRISRKCKSSKISRELIFANFAIVVQIAKINSRENKFSRKLVLAKISTFKVLILEIIRCATKDEKEARKYTINNRAPCSNYRRNFTRRIDAFPFKIS